MQDDARSLIVMAPILEIAKVSKRYRLGENATLNGSFRETLIAGSRRLVRGFALRSKTRDPSEGWFWALRDVSYAIDAGDTLGIIGLNGAGKSTLLKILSRITDPTEGVVKVRGRIASLLEVGTGFHPELTGRENIYLNGAMLGMSRAEIRAKFDEIVAFSELEKFLDTPVKHYSSGMYVRMGFAVAAHLDPEILVVDEVLAVGDMSFQKKCLGKMSEFGRAGRTILFVSHNMAAIRHLCQKAIVLREGRLTFADTASAAIEHYIHSMSRHRGSSNSHIVDLGSAPGRIPRSQPLLRGVEIRTGDSMPFNGFVQIGAPLQVHIHFRLDRPTAEFEHRMNFIDLYGQTIFHASSAFEPNHAWRGRAGEQTLICEIPSLQLIPGEYRVDVAIMVARELKDKVEDAFRVTVVASDYYGSGRVPRWGTCVLKQHWRQA